MEDMERPAISLIQIYRGDLWDLHDPSKGCFVVIPTNLTYTRSRKAVMGRGIAAQAAAKYKKLTKSYGKALSEQGIKYHIHVYIKRGLIMCPVKQQFCEDANIIMVQRMVKEIKELLKFKAIKSIAIPMLGCGYGGLTYEKVLPLLLNTFQKCSKVILVIPNDTLYASEAYRESFLPGIDGRTDKRVTMSGTFSDVPI